MKSFGNLILITLIFIVIFWIFMALRPANAGTLALACKGVTGLGMDENDPRPKSPISTGMIVNLTAKTIHITDVIQSAEIDDMTETLIHFRGQTMLLDIYGNIDRVTGQAFAFGASRQFFGEGKHWVLNCKPAQKMF